MVKTKASYAKSSNERVVALHTYEQNVCVNKTLSAFLRMRGKSKSTYTAQCLRVFGVLPTNDWSRGRYAHWCVTRCGCWSWTCRIFSRWWCFPEQRYANFPEKEIQNVDIRGRISRGQGYDGEQTIVSNRVSEKDFTGGYEDWCRSPSFSDPRRNLHRLFV